MSEGGSNPSSSNHGGTNSRSATVSSGGGGGGGGSSLEALRRANAYGKIPVRLTLAKTSLSSATPPQPQHVLLSRQTFLHLGLEASIRKLHEHALPTLSFVGSNIGNNLDGHTTVVVVQEDDEDRISGTNEPNQGDENGDASSDDNKKDGDGVESDNESGGDDDDKESSDSKTKELAPYPICWFEDVVTEQPLRWQYFVGVLFDSLHPTPKPSQSHPQSNDDKDHAPTPPVLPQALPWEIRVHFRSYPSTKLLELCDPDLGNTGGVLDTLRRIFMNSLKQGYVVRYGNSKEALNLSKQSHEAIWEGITQENYDMIAPIVFRDDEFDVETSAPTTTTGEPGTTTSVKENENENKDDNGDDTQPEQKNDEPPVSQPNTSTTKEDSGGTTNRVSNQPSDSSDSYIRHETNNLAAIPVRLSIDPTKPMIQRRCEGGSASSKMTLGSLLLEWAPSHFERIVNSSSNEAVEETLDKTKNFDREGIRPKERSTSWRIAGLVPPLSTPLLDLWLALRHPDNFLYISLSVEPQ